MLSVCNRLTIHRGRDFWYVMFYLQDSLPHGVAMLRNLRLNTDKCTNSQWRGQLNAACLAFASGP